MRGGFLGIAAAAVLVVVLLGAAQTAPGRSALSHAGLLGRAEPYTELAFARPSELPQRLPTGRSRLMTVPFTVHNAEGTAQTYAWTIRSGGTVLARGRLRTAAGERAYVSRAFVAPCHGKRTRVDVRLAQPAESIGFWAECR